MNLKKILIPLVSSVFLSTSVYALEVGDKMPIYPKSKLMGVTQWSSQEKFMDGRTLYYDLNEDGIPDVSLTYRDCNGRKQFFAFYEHNKNILYLDNKSTDGIDEIVKTPKETRKIEDDAPVCNLKV